MRRHTTQELRDLFQERDKRAAEERKERIMDWVCVALFAAVTITLYITA
jgi:hypothetical protein